MDANVINLGNSDKIPAGIFIGTEVFFYSNAIFALYNGKCIPFENLPRMEQKPFVDMFLADLNGQQFIKHTFGITGFESGFKQWLFCKYGALDGRPDSCNGKITPDTYNSACLRTDCPGRGKFCGRESGLKNYQVETLQQLISGKTLSETAANLHVSLPAIKSRVEKMKEALAVTNVVALAAKAVEYGIGDLGL